MRYISLTYNNKDYTFTKEINNILTKCDLEWLINCEIENAKLEIKNSTLIWKDGDFNNGTWEYGIVEKGNFRNCIWKGGLFYSGTFKGKFKNGIKYN